MQGKKPTYQERKILESKGLSPYDWLVQKNANDFMQLIKRDTGEVKTIQK